MKHKLTHFIFTFFIVSLYLILFSPTPAYASTIPYEITTAIPDHQTPSQGITFFTKDMDINYTSGNIIFSQNPDGTGTTYIDDGVEITVTKPDGTQKSHLYIGFNNPPIDVTYLFGIGENHVNVKLRDFGGAIIGSSTMYLVNTNTSEPASPPDEEYFFDDFSGTSFDSSKWNISNLTNGKRWCADSTSNYELGVWFNLLNGTCHNLTQTPPLGQATTAYGMGVFSSGTTRTFPYMWNGLSQSIIPTSGNFAFETRMKFDSNSSNGTGIVVSNWESPVAEGSNPPPDSQKELFAIWSDNVIRLLDKTSQVSNLSWHTYRLEYKGNKYSLFIDTVKILDQIESVIHPNTVSIGNPLFAFWGAADWSDFRIDYIKVTKPFEEPTPTPTPDVLGISTAPTQPPTPAPTVTPTPAPFLDLPWNYDCQQISDKKAVDDCEEKLKVRKSTKLTFSEAATKINTFFDHTYPFLCCSLVEPAKITTYENKNTDIGYSSHDGYDFGKLAGVYDGDPVLAAATGEATFLPKSKSGGGGNVIKINHGNQFETVYEHINEDKDLVIATEGASVHVEKGEHIGNVGHDGNCWILDSNGNKIWNTPDCGHIHFTVIQDKENNKNFEDNNPDGLTDPYGWEPIKDNTTELKDPDPWQSYSYTYKNTEKTGNSSNYLWTSILDKMTAPITPNETTLKAGNFTINFPQGTVGTTVTATIQSSPDIQTKINGEEYTSIGSALNAKAKDILGNIYHLFLSFFTITINFSEAALYNIDTNSLAVYSSEDGKNWVKENQDYTINLSSHLATVSANHFTYYALMGKIDDTTAPLTNIIFNKEPLENNWFSSEVAVTFNSTDNKSGVNYTYYKKQDDEWVKYSNNPLLFTEDGNYHIQFYSNDKGGNVEDVQTQSFNIDKTPPVTTTGTITGTKGENDWYTTDVIVELNAQDQNGSGISKTEYSLNNSGYSTYSGTIVLDKEDENTLTFRSTDKAGNVEEEKSLTIKIDKTPPDTLLYLSSSQKGEEWYGSEVTASLSSTDATSGTPETYFKLNDDENFSIYTEPIKIDKEGQNSLTYYSIDKAGNKETPQSKVIKIDQTPPEAEITYDLSAFDSKINGKDLGPTKVAIDKTYPLRPKFTITDQANNSLIINTNKIKLGKQVALTIKNLQYNSNPVISLDPNVFFTLAQVDSQQNLKQLDQYYSLKDDKKIFTAYSISTGLTKIFTKTHGTTGYSREDKPGIVILQLETNKGTLKYRY